MRQLKLHLFDECGPFVPIYWWRYVSFTNPNKLLVDSQIEIYNSEPVGFIVHIDLSKQVPVVMDPNGFMPRITKQTVRVMWRDHYYNAAIKGLYYSAEAAQDLRAVHNVEANAVFAELHEQDAADWLNGLKP